MIEGGIVNTTAVLSLCVVLSSAAAAAQACGTDNDCPGDLVCERGTCVSTAPGQGASASQPSSTPAAPPSGAARALAQPLPGVRGEACQRKADCAGSLICKARKCEVQEDRETEKRVARGLAIGGGISFVSAYLITMVTVFVIVAETCGETCRKAGYDREATAAAVVPFFGAIDIIGKLDRFVANPSQRPLAAFGLGVGEFFQVAGVVAGVVGGVMLVRLWSVENAELAVMPMISRDGAGAVWTGRFDLVELFRRSR
jgi:hypothetical protein